MQNTTTKLIKLGLGLFITTTLLAGCSSSDSGSSDGGSNSSGSNQVKQTKSYTKQPVSINESNAGEITEVAIESLTALDGALEIADFDGVLPASSNSRVQTAATNNYNCSGGGRFEFEENISNNNDTTTIKANYSSCKEGNSTINGVFNIEKTYQETSTKITEKNYYNINNFSITSSTASINISGSMQENYSEDFANNTESYSLIVNKLKTTSKGNYSSYGSVVDSYLNGSIEGSCKLLGNTETCTEEIKFIESEYNGNWFVVSDGKITSTTESWCEDIFDFNCNSDTYTQTGSHNLNSSKTEMYGQLKFTKDNLVFQSGWYADEPIAGFYIVQGSGSSKIVFEFTGKNKANLSITGANGSNICTNHPINTSDLYNLKTVVANCN